MSNTPATSQVIGFRNATLTVHASANCGITRRTRYANTPQVIEDVVAAEHACQRCGYAFPVVTREAITEAWRQAARIPNKRSDRDWPAYCERSAARMIEEVIG